MIMVIILVCMILIVNILFVYGFSYFGDYGEGKCYFFVEMVCNFLIIVCVVGFLLNVFNLLLIGLVVEVLELIFWGMVLFGLLVVGVGINFVFFWVGKF